MCLLVGYGVAAVLVVVYFAWESGPIHISRRVESGYLTMVLFLVYVVSFIWAHFGRSFTITRQAGVQFRQLQRILVIMMILQHSVMPRVHPHPKFAEEAGVDRRSATLSGLQCTAKARKLAIELDALISETLARSGLRGAGMLSTMLGPPLLFVTMMAQELVVSSRASSDMSLPGLIVLEVFFLALWFVSELRRFLQLGGLNKELHLLVSWLVRSRDKDTLNYVLAHVSIGTFMEVARRDTIKQLTDLALEMGLLSLLSRSILVHAMQQRGLRRHKDSQKAVWRIIFSSKGRELTTLKNLIDSSGGYQNLYKLVHADTTGGRLRESILAHFAAQAKTVRNEIGGAYGVKILSDVDDTLYSSGGKFPTGCDTRFPRHMCYPGCLSLYRALDQHRDCQTPSCNLVFVSARPHLYKDWTEDHSYRLFQSLVAQGRMHTSPTLLPGRLKNGVWAFLTAKCMGPRAWRAVGEAKYDTYVNFRALYSEYDFVFCGDDGQGDLLAAQKMAAEQDNIAPLIAAIIHKVLPGGSERALAMEPPSQRGEEWVNGLEKRNIFTHRSYVGAALAIHSVRPDILTAVQLAQIAADAVEDFEDMRSSFCEVPRHWFVTEDELDADVLAASAVVQDAGLEPLRRLTLSIPVDRSSSRSIWKGHLSKRNITNGSSPSGVSAVGSARSASPSPTQSEDLEIGPHFCSKSRRSDASRRSDEGMQPTKTEEFCEDQAVEAIADAARARRKAKGSRGVIFLDKAVHDMRRSSSRLDGVGTSVTKFLSQFSSSFSSFEVSNAPPSRPTPKMTSKTGPTLLVSRTESETVPDLPKLDSSSFKIDEEIMEAVLQEVVKSDRVLIGTGRSSPSSYRMTTPCARTPHGTPHRSMMAV